MGEFNEENRAQEEANMHMRKRVLAVAAAALGLATFQAGQASAATNLTFLYA